MPYIVVLTTQGKLEQVDFQVLVFGNRRWERVVERREFQRIAMRERD
jgi:hypothetical protein